LKCKTERKIRVRRFGKKFERVYIAPPLIRLQPRRRELVLVMVILSHLMLMETRAAINKSRGGVYISAPYLF